jgi:SPP1 gp7 family putative phage head morphogenesis protein
MPRHPIRATAYPETRQIRSTATPDELKRLIYQQPPRSEEWRTYYGRSLNLDRIEIAIRNAQAGYMKDLTDLSRETCALDPHLTAVLNKRFNAIAAAPWDVIPAEGPGVDPGTAKLYAEIVREQILKIEKFAQGIRQLAWGLFDARAALETQWVLREPDKRGVTWYAAELSWIHPRRLHFGPRRELRLSDDNYLGGGFVPLGLELDALWPKFVQFKPQLFGEYPEREGLAPRCMYWSFFKRFGARDRMILLELFGKPWRIVTVDEESQAGPQDLIDAERAADALGGNTSVRMPRGTKLETVQPGTTAGAVHSDVIAESDRQISKLVLGQTGTTDAVSNGLGAGMQSSIMQDDQLLIFTGDCDLVASAVEDTLTDPIIALNFGAAALTHAPKFVIRAEIPTDQKAETERLQAALNAGLEISLDEAYEIAGFRRPTANEPKLVMVDATGLGNRQPTVVFPGEDPEPEPTPTPASTPEPEPSPAPTEAKPTEEDPSKTLPNVGPISIAAAVALSSEMIDQLVARMAGLGANLEGDPHAGHVHLAKGPALKQPETIHGSLEDIITRSVRSASLVTDRWASALAEAVEGKTKASDINRALKKAHARLDLLPFSRLVNSAVNKGSMTGMLDSQYEADNEIVVEPEEFPTPETEKAEAERREELRVMLASGGDDDEDDDGSGAQPAAPDPNTQKKPTFTRMPYADAVRYFKSKQPVTRSVFDRLQSAAKQRAFTVAGLASDKALAVAQAELTRAISEGRSLDSFAKDLKDRFQSAGMSSLNPSHLETVYRTNVVDAYNVGRRTEMSQPARIEARPYWRIYTVRDARQRETHGAVHGWVLRADDSFWRTKGGPPWGFNCRCRVASMSPRRAKGMTIRTGSEIQDLPDDGFDATVLFPPE